VKIWSTCFAYLLCFNATMAQSESRRALEMAECGYLLGLVAEQLHARDETSDDLQRIVGEIVDYTNLYYFHSGQDSPLANSNMSLAMYTEIMDRGRDVFNRRIVGMQVETANKLALRVMDTCREDLHLLGLKLRHG